MGANVAQGSVEGIQAATGVNVAKADVKGAQLAAGVNVAKKVQGGQFSGAGVNVAGEVKGAQVGLINVTRGRVRGAQFGLINWADEADASVALLPLTRKGGVAADVWTSDTAAINLGMRLRAKYTYGILAVGVHPFGKGRGCSRAPRNGPWGR